MSIESPCVQAPALQRSAMCIADSMLLLRKSYLKNTRVGREQRSLFPTKQGVEPLIFRRERRSPFPLSFDLPV